MSVANSAPKRFNLSLQAALWRQLADELRTMEGLPHVAAVPVEKLLERDRAGEQLQAIVTALLQGHAQAQKASDTGDARDDDILHSSLPLLRATAKYLLTACDRLRRAALRQAWAACREQSASESAENSGDQHQQALQAARLWDRTMRELSTQHGVMHPLSGMVEPLPLGDAELQQLGLPSEDLLNGQDILAS